MAEFFGNDFKQDRWQSAALKNGYALLGHRRYYDAIAFFLLGSSLKDAIDIAQNRLNDKQLALLIAMLYKGDDERLVLVEQYANESADPFIHSLHHWMRGAYVAAVTEFLGTSHELNDTTIYAFYRFICRHPLYTKALAIGATNEQLLTAYRQPGDLFIAATIESLLAGSPLTAYFIVTEGQVQFSTTTASTSVTTDSNEVMEKMEMETGWGD